MVVEARHFCVLIDAFAKAGERQRALRTYSHALQRGAAQDVGTYIAAVHACGSAGAAPDVDLALSVLDDLRRYACWGLRPMAGPGSGFSLTSLSSLLDLFGDRSHPS